MIEYSLSSPAFYIGDIILYTRILWFVMFYHILVQLQNSIYDISNLSTSVFCVLRVFSYYHRYPIEIPCILFPLSFLCVTAAILFFQHGDLLGNRVFFITSRSKQSLMFCVAVIFASMMQNATPSQHKNGITCGIERET